MLYQCQKVASSSALSKLGPTEPSLELRDRPATWVLSCPSLRSPQCRGVKAGPVGWVPQGGPPALAPCFPTGHECHGYREPQPVWGEGRVGGRREEVLKWHPTQAPPHTFGLLATKAASIIPPPVLGAHSAAQGPRFGLLVPVGPRHLLVHVVRQVPHDAYAVLHRLWEKRAGGVRPGGHGGC